MRGKTRFVFMVLVTLMAVQFFALTTPSSLAHDTQVAAASEIADGGAKAEQLEQEYATCGSPEHTFPNGLPRTRDRYRAAADLIPQPVPPARSSCALYGRTPADAPVAWESTPHLGSSAARSPAVLQVFLR